MANRISRRRPSRRTTPDRTAAIPLQAQRRRPFRPGQFLVLTGVLAGMLGLGMGCASSRNGASASAQYGLPRNVYREAGRFPGEFKRVAVLPIVISGQDAVLENGRDALQPLFHSELISAARFETVTVSQEQCRQWTGRSSWSGQETLPRDFFERLREMTGCDAVLFCQLTRYRPYPPVAVGWRMQLVAVSPLRVWWAIDELFSSGDAVVADAARAYYRKHFAPPTGSDPDSILATPRRFGQFTLTVLTESLPTR